jgi:hypothetical protein
MVLFHVYIQIAKKKEKNKENILWVGWVKRIFLISGIIEV